MPLTLLKCPVSVRALLLPGNRQGQGRASNQMNYAKLCPSLLPTDPIFVHRYSSHTAIFKYTCTVEDPRKHEANAHRMEIMSAHPALSISLRFWLGETLYLKCYHIKTFASVSCSSHISLLAVLLSQLFAQNFRMYCCFKPFSLQTIQLAYIRMQH